jgi:hypothetical protein
MANYDRLNQTGLTTMLNRIAQLVEPVISILPISKGGTGNADGYIRTGKASNTTAAEASTIEGVNNTVEGKNSHAEGNSNTVNKITEYPNADLSCHVEGYSNTMTAQYSHAEGANNTVTGATAHAEGMNNTVSQQGAHAEGRNNTASGYYSHAEGGYNNATSYFTHAAGSYNNAGYENQTVVGTYNNNKATTLFEVGNGAENARSNAFEVYADGHVNAPGGFYKNGTELVTGVSSFNSRTGAITPTAGDYDATQVSYSSGTSVKAKIDSVAGVWTTPVLCLTGDTSVTITNSAIHTTSTINPYIQTASGAVVAYSNLVVTEGHAVITFGAALTEVASVKLQILNV